MSTPEIQRILTLRQKFMPLIDGGDAGDRASLVVEDFVCHMGGTPSRAIQDPRT